MTPDQVVSTMLIPALAGLAVGFLAGVLTGIAATLQWIDRRRAQGKPMPIYTDANNPNPGHVPWRGKEHFSRLGWFLAAAGVLGLLAGTFSLYQSRATATCLAAFIENSANVQLERGEAAQLDRDAARQTRDANRSTINAMVELLSADVPREQFPQERDRFLERIRGDEQRLAEIDRLYEQADKRRAENPLPEQPDC